jgi:hypothetical protein
MDFHGDPCWSWCNYTNAGISNTDWDEETDKLYDCWRNGAKEKYGAEYRNKTGMGVQCQGATHYPSWSATNRPLSLSNAMIMVATVAFVVPLFG